MRIQIQEQWLSSKVNTLWNFEIKSQHGNNIDPKKTGSNIKL
jgi:hypothetical protein